MSLDKQRRPDRSATSAPRSISLRRHVAVLVTIPISFRRGDRLSSLMTVMLKIVGRTAEHLADALTVSRPVSARPHHASFGFGYAVESLEALKVERISESR